MSVVLDTIRAKYPGVYDDMADEDMAQAVATKFPQYLDQDKELGQLVQKANSRIPGTDLYLTPPPDTSTPQGGAAFTRQMMDAEQARYTAMGIPPAQHADYSRYERQQQQQFEDAEAENRIQTPLGAFGHSLMTGAPAAVPRGGKYLLAAMSDIAHNAVNPGSPNTENQEAFIKDPLAPLPAEEGAAEMHGIGSFPTKAAIGAVKAVPALGVSVALGGAGVPANIAAGAPMMFNERGEFDPKSMAVAMALPTVAQGGSSLVAKAISKIPATAQMELNNATGQITGRVSQKLGGIQFSNDTVRKFLEQGGGAIMANAYLLATQAPEIMALPPEQRGDAIIDNIAGNLAPSLLAFSSRPGEWSDSLKQIVKDNPVWAQRMKEMGQDMSAAYRKHQAARKIPAEATRPADAPVPEPSETLDAQVGATLDPENPKAVTLVTPGETVPHDNGLTPVPTNDGIALVNTEKIHPDEAATAINAGKYGKILGMGSDTKPEDGTDVLQTKTKDGTVIQEEVVTPETLDAAKAAGEKVAPGGTQEVKPADQILQERKEATGAPLAVGDKATIEGHPSVVAAVHDDNLGTRYELFHHATDPEGPAAIRSTDYWKNEVNGVKPYRIAEHAATDWNEITHPVQSWTKATLIDRALHHIEKQQVIRDILGAPNDAAAIAVAKEHLRNGGMGLPGRILANLKRGGGSGWEGTKDGLKLMVHGEEQHATWKEVVDRARMYKQRSEAAPTPVEQKPIEPAPEPEAPQEMASPHPGNKIADSVAGRLNDGGTVSGVQVKAWGIGLGLSEKELEEWAEVGSTLAAYKIARNPDTTDLEKFHALVNLYGRMPTAQTRTTETRVSQQYSTPPPLAFAAGILADLKHGTRLLEPTAGHGMLMLGANPNANIALNEMDAARAARLERIRKFLLDNGAENVGVRQHDAASFSFYQRAEAGKMNRVAMNPPFGNVLGEGGETKDFPIVNAKTKAKTTKSIDTAIMLNMFEAMTANGRGFAIVGAKTGTPFATMGTDKNRADSYRIPPFLDLFNRFHVVDWFTVSGDLYNKMGAGWPVDVIVVHGKGATPSADNGGFPRPWMKVPRVIESWDELAKLLPQNERTTGKAGGAGGVAPGERTGRASTGAGSAKPEGQRAPEAVTPRREQPPADSGAGSGRESIPVESPRPTPQPPKGVAGDTGAGIGKGTPEPVGEVAGAGTKRGDTAAGNVGGSGKVAAGPGKTESRQPIVKPSVSVEGLPSSLMVPYVGASRGPSLNLVAPRNIANQMLAAQQELEKDHRDTIDHFVSEILGIETRDLHKMLSGAQIDAIGLAIRNIRRGSALITADETGVGKGRVVAALMLYAKLSGRVPIFVTAKKNLYSDMVSRDLVALGVTDYKPFITDSNYEYEDGKGNIVKGKGGAAGRIEEMEQALRTGNLPGGAHAVFTTYDQLKADKPKDWSETPAQKFARQNRKVEKPDGPRWKLLRALAPRAIFIMDEAHLAAGPTSEINRKFTSVLPTASGNYYSSATFAKRPDNLGIYGLGTLIKRAGLSPEQLTEALTAGGVPMQQALTSMLAESGELVRRQQDWKGVDIRFKPTGDATADVKAADTYTAFIRQLMDLSKIINRAIAGLEDGENQVRGEESKVSVEPITFGSRLFNLSNQYLLALRAQSIVDKTVEELKAGRKPFIALYNTMEGPIMDLRARKLPISFNGILLREMTKMLKVKMRDPQAEGGEREVTLLPEDLPDGGRFYREMERAISATDFSRLPISPIDFIKQKVQAAGYTITELTARDGEVEDTGGEVTITKREKVERNKILKGYNNGEHDAIVVNGSGSTGLSAHTDPKFKDQRQRVMVVGQPAPDINEFMQMLGRVMRSGQTSKPAYWILHTHLAAERRFATMLRGKMTSLNANTTAEGESGMTQSEGFADDVFNAVGDKVVAQVMAANEDIALQLGLGAVSGDEGEEGLEGYARKATGRFVLLKNADAQRMWDEIIREFKDTIEQLDEQGENPLKAAAEDLRARTLETTTIDEGTGTTLFDGPANLEKVQVKPSKQPPTHAEALQRAKDNLPTIRARVGEWMRQSKEAEEARVMAAESAGQVGDQISRIRDTYGSVRTRLADAVGKIGDTHAVDMVGDGGTSYYGVGVDLKLADKSLSDFASASRQQLILATNTYKGKLTLPLSKVFRGDEAGEMLRTVDEDDAPKQFDSTAESTAERYIITGNLLRGWESARSAGAGRPRVAIYTKDDGSLNTGILMPTTYDPSQASAAEKVLQTVDDFKRAIQSGVAIRSTPTSSVHPVSITGGRLAVPSNMQGRTLWGDPAFNSFFERPPMQMGPQFVGHLLPDQMESAFRFLTSRGVRLIVAPGDTAKMQGPGGGGRSIAARGAFVSGANTGPGKVPKTVTFGGLAFVKPLHLPELVQLTRDLSGFVPKVRKMPARGNNQTWGQFGDGMITLDPRIFKDPAMAAAVLGHELGHLVDYLPHETLKRGNLLGHLLALKSWLKHSFGPLKNQPLKDELMRVTMWWRPYDIANDPKSYVDYRATPEELYADALSVMFNAPAELEKRAPKFYEAFWKHIDARPPVRDGLFAIQEMLNKGLHTTIASRENNLTSHFAEGEQIWKQAVKNREAAARSFDGYWTGLAMALYWNFYPLESRAQKVEARGVKLPLEQDPRVFLDDLGFKDTTIMKWGRTIHEKVIQPIENAGMTLQDAGLYLRYDRILNGDRGELANDGGIDRDAAQLGLLKMRLDLGMDRMQVLQTSLDRFHDEFFKLQQRAVKVGAINKTVFEQIIKPNRGHYSTNAVLDYLDDYIPAGVKAQLGSLKAAANPFQATVLKAISLHNLIAYQKAKSGTVDFLQKFFPDDVEKATQEHPPTRKGRGLLVRLENGRPVSYYTDPFIAEAFDTGLPMHMNLLIKPMVEAFRRFIYPLIITYKPSFMVNVFARDAQRTARNLPGVRWGVGLFPAAMIGKMPQTAQRFLGPRTYQTPGGRDYTGQSSPLVREMEANMALGTPFDTLERAHRDDFMGDLLRRMRVMPDHALQGWYNSAIFTPVRKMLNGLELGNMTNHTLAKLAAYDKLRQAGWSPRDASVWVRNYAGLSNINKKGTMVRQVRALVPFWNVWMQQIRADAKLAGTPSTRSGWWFRYMMSNGLFRVFAKFAALGLFGAMLKSLYDGVGKHDKDKYNVLPLGFTEGDPDLGKPRVAFLRMPEDDASRFIGGVMQAGIGKAYGENPGSLSGLIDFTAGEIPSENPVLAIPSAWAQFAMGHNPVNYYTGANIVPDRNWSAGGWDAVEPMAHWTVNQAGVGNFFSYDSTSATTTQFALSAAPGVNNFLKTSDQGYREQQRAAETAVQVAKDQEFLRLPNQVRSLEVEYFRLQRMGQDIRTPEQEGRMADLKYWYENAYQPMWESIREAMDAKQPGEAAKLRTDLQEVSKDWYSKRQ